MRGRNAAKLRRANTHRTIQFYLNGDEKMAHELTTRSDGTVEMFVAGEPAWHKLGVNVEKAQTWKEAIKLAGLDWKVSKKQLEHDGTPVPAYGLFRDDWKTWLGLAGLDYHPIQNERAFDWVDTLVQAENGAHYRSAGSLYGGSTIWCLADVPEQIRIAGTDDVTQNYLLFVNHHRIGKSALAKLVQERVVCHNTLTAALAEEGKVLSIPHRESFEKRLTFAKDALKDVRGQIKNVNAVMNIFAKTKLTSAVIGDILKQMFPTITDSTQAQNQARDILELFEDNDRNAFPSEQGSAYALMNAGTRYVDHVKNVRTDDQEPVEVARARGALFGAGESFKFAIMNAIVTTLSKNSLASFSEKEVAAIGIL